MHELQYSQGQRKITKFCEHDKLYVIGYKAGGAEEDWEGVVSTENHEVSTCVLYSLCGCLHKLNT
jgi:hypothetical protein